MFAPAATPRSTIEALNATLKKALSDSRVKERLEAQNCELVAGTPEELAAVVKADQAKWSRIIREHKITIE
jgi:tripartite-type tricarboxylate transporter receptor subunit TctC